jgi:hypothetical protein
MKYMKIEEDNQDDHNTNHFKCSSVVNNHEFWMARTELHVPYTDNHQSAVTISWKQMFQIKRLILSFFSGV